MDRNDTIKRISGMKKRMVTECPTELLPERALLVTEAYKKYASEPPVLKRAYALRHILENMTLFIDDGELFVGHNSPKPRSPIACPELGARWILADLDTFATRPADAIGLTDENKEILRKCLESWQDSSLDSVTSKLIPDETKKAIADHMITVGAQGTAHGNIAVNNKKLLEKGLRGMIGEIDAKLASFQPQRAVDGNKTAFWRAAKISLEAVIAFAHRYADEAEKRAEKCADAKRREELRDIAAVLRKVPEFPAESFREAIQSVWLIYVATQIEADPHAMLLGRFDQYMYPYYKKDKEEGRLSDEEAVELIAHIWIKCTAIIKLMDSVTTRTFAGFPLFQNITLAGQGPRGEDVCNELTELIMDAASLAKVTQPSLSFRYHNKVSHKALLRACEMIKLGLGYPAIMNDNCIIPKHLIRGATLEEARGYCMNCVESDIEGACDSRSNGGYVNMPKAFLLALNDGADPSTGEQCGPHTGKLADFKSFDELMKAFDAQVAYFVKLIVRAYDLIDGAHAVHAPEPFTSALLDDCIASGLTRQEGGVRYNFSGIFGVGLASASDAMAAVRKVIFDDKSAKAEELLGALKDDFAGADELRKLCCGAPKFGNDDDYVDLIAREAAHIFCKEVVRYPCMRGGFYIPELHSVSTHVYFGELTGATADGRLAETHFSDGASPVGGRDRSGPTAAMLSMSKLDHIEVLQGVLYNQKFSPSVLNAPNSAALLADYIRAWCDLGGHHIQFNVVSSGDLKEAQRKPEEHRDLIVRVAGYSAYFAELNTNTQDEIIARTEYEELN